LVSFPFSLENQFSSFYFSRQTDFNLEFYTEVQDLSYLENALSSTSPRYTALNMAICELIEDFGLVGFETLAVEVRYVACITKPNAEKNKTLMRKNNHPQDKHSMLNLTRAIDRATGYVFVPAAGTATAQLPEGAVHDPSAASSAQPNVHALLSSAMGPRVVGLRSDVRDVQERWVDAREEWDAHERALWRREGEALGRAAAEVEKQQRKLNIRERK
jgi:GPN-loop GTPase